MRIMMDENQVHHDIQSKLWQVYSECRKMVRKWYHSPVTAKGTNKQLPKAQRRGAIAILGMLALAKRSVLSDRVETMLKIGLGPLGKVYNSSCASCCVN